MADSAKNQAENLTIFSLKKCEMQVALRLDTTGVQDIIWDRASSQSSISHSSHPDNSSHPACSLLSLPSVSTVLHSCYSIPTYNGYPPTWLSYSRLFFTHASHDLPCHLMVSWEPFSDDFTLHHNLFARLVLLLTSTLALIQLSNTCNPPPSSVPNSSTFSFASSFHHSHWILSFHSQTNHNSFAPFYTLLLLPTANEPPGTHF